MTLFYPELLLQPLEVPSCPFQFVSYNIIGKLLRSNGFDSILVVTDSFTKFGHFIPWQESMNSREIAELFLRDVCKL